jgi:RNA polymerase sigma-70 factor (ECF subfamily)
MIPSDFRAFYERWLEHVLRSARALGGADRDREDIAQEVFLVARQRFESFDGANPAAWLYQITRRKVRDFRTRAWVRKVFTRDRVDNLDALPDDAEGPAGALERKQDRRTLIKILNKMHEDRRSVFVLFEIDGLSGEEIASIQGIPISTVWWRVHKARKEFVVLAAKYRRALGEDGE